MNQELISAKAGNETKIKATSGLIALLSLTGHRTVQEKQQREKPERCDVFVFVWAFFAWLPY